MGYHAYFLAHKSLTVTGKNGTQTEQYHSVKTPIASVFSQRSNVELLLYENGMGTFY